MKKLSILILSLLTLFCFVSCGNKAVDENGCFTEMTSAMETAKKKNQDILVIITMNGDDEYSTDFVENVIKSEEFKKNVASKYAVLDMDFSQATYEKTVSDEKFATVVQNNSRTASMLNAQVTPSFFLLTKEMYFIAELEYTDEIKTPEAFEALLTAKQEEADNIHAQVQTINKSSKEDKIAAIDSFYESTDMTYRPFLADLIKEVIKLDKDNSSGLLSKYLLANADAEGSSKYMDGDMAGAAQAYIDVTKEEYLLPEHKQQAYYMAAYILTMSGSTDYTTILQYLNDSIDAYPDGPDVPAIQQVIVYLTQTISNFSAGDTTLGVQ